jgi:hypothetical protein
MIDLSQPTEPYELELPYGLKVTVRPLTTAGMPAAQAGARRAVEAIEPRPESVAKRDWPSTGCPTSRPRANGTASTRRS